MLCGHRFTGRKSQWPLIWYNNNIYNVVLPPLLHCLLAKLKHVALYFHCKSLEPPGWGLGAPLLWEVFSHGGWLEVGHFDVGPHGRQWWLHHCRCGAHHLTLRMAELQPFASMFRLDDDTLEEDVMALMEAEDEAEHVAWLKNLGRYRCVEECKRERWRVLNVKSAWCVHLLCGRALSPSLSTSLTKFQLLLFIVISNLRHHHMHPKVMHAISTCVRVPALPGMFYQGGRPSFSPASFARVSLQG